MPSTPDFFSSGPRLSELTTLRVGGIASHLASPMNDEEVADAIAWADDQQREILVVGGGSNLLVADDELDVVVLQSADYTMEVTRDGDDVLLDVGAGVEWDELVAFCVEERFAGVECLSGIPGRVGAAPMQNIGAYGQEVAETIESVTVVDRTDRALRTFRNADCGFAYRASHFKHAWRDQQVITGVRFRLRAGGGAAVRYAELRRALGLSEGVGTVDNLAEVRRAVLAIRKRKAMVLHPTDTNTHSAGSFFMNPIVDAATVEATRERLASAGVDTETMPAYPVDGGQTKLSAAWLIERSGFSKGFAFGRAGLSTRHCLALINRGDASARDLINLASIVRRGVRETTGVTLVPEPVFYGFDLSVDELLR